MPCFPKMQKMDIAFFASHPLIYIYFNSNVKSLEIELVHMNNHARVVCKSVLSLNRGQSVYGCWGEGG